MRTRILARDDVLVARKQDNHLSKKAKRGWFTVGCLRANNESSPSWVLLYGEKPVGKVLPTRDWLWASSVNSFQVEFPARRMLVIESCSDTSNHIRPWVTILFPPFISIHTLQNLYRQPQDSQKITRYHAGHTIALSYIHNPPKKCHHPQSPPQNTTPTRPTP